MKKINTITTEEFGTVEIIGANSPFVTPVIVEKSVVERLAKLLGKASFRKIKREFFCEVEGTMNLKEFTTVLQEELSFHLTVNQLIEVEEDRSTMVNHCPDNDVNSWEKDNV